MTEHKKYDIMQSMQQLINLIYSKGENSLYEQPLVAEGWDVIVFVPSKEEDSDRITCGNALISGDINKS